MSSRSPPASGGIRRRTSSSRCRAPGKSPRARASSDSALRAPRCCGFRIASSRNSASASLASPWPIGEQRPALDQHLARDDVGGFGPGLELRVEVARPRPVLGSIAEVGQQRAGADVPGRPFARRFELAARCLHVAARQQHPRVGHEIVRPQRGLCLDRGGAPVRLLRALEIAAGLGGQAGRRVCRRLLGRGWTVAAGAGSARPAPAATVGSLSSTASRGGYGARLGDGRHPDARLGRRDRDHRRGLEIDHCQPFAQEAGAIGAGDRPAVELHQAGPGSLAVRPDRAPRPAACAPGRRPAVRSRWSRSSAIRAPRAPRSTSGPAQSRVRAACRRRRAAPAACAGSRRRRPAPPLARRPIAPVRASSADAISARAAACGSPRRA